MSAWRASGRVSTIVASTIALDEMWTYLGARKEEKRNDLWVWTAVVEERGGSGWIDFEVGGRDESYILALAGASAGCGALRDRRIWSVWGAAGQQACGWEVRRGELERGIAFGIARQVEPSHRGVLQDSWNADLVACDGVAEVRMASTRLHVLRIPLNRNHFQTYAPFAILVWLWRRDFAC